MENKIEENQILETWDIHNRINLYLLDSISPESLISISASKGRNVAEQFVHIHNTRLMWLKQATPISLDELVKIEKADAPDKRLLRASIEHSGNSIRDLLSKAIESGGKVKGFKPHVVAYLGYLVSHESHHRGQIIMTLKQAGYPVDRKIQFGLWEWGVR